MKFPSFEYLNIVIAVAESKNFNEAANKLGITQPSVSYKLKELEQHLPVPLFQLEGKRKVLTHYGRALYKIAKAKSDELHKNIEDLHRVYENEKNLTLRIGGRNEVLEYVSTRIKFAGTIELINCTSNEAIEKLLSHYIDIAISYNRPDSTEMLSKKLFQSKSYFIIHKKLLKNKPLSLALITNPDFLKSIPCLIYNQEGHMLSNWLKHLGLSMDDMEVKYIAEDWRCLERLVSEGFGYAFVPEYIKSVSPEVLSVEIPSHILPAYTFFAIFEKGLKQILAFKEILAFKQFT